MTASEETAAQGATESVEDMPNAAAATGSGGGSSLGFAGRHDRGVAQWTLWQLCDSGLPTGGFAHSGGLEAAAAQGIVRAKHSGSLLRFVRGALANAASLQLPLVRAALRARTLYAWLEVDSVAHACITAEASRRASLAQGAGLLRAAQAMFPLGEECGGIISAFRALVRGGSAAFPEGKNELLSFARGGRSASEGAVGGGMKDYEGNGGKVDAAREGMTARGHHAPAFGMVCRALGIGEREAARAFMFLVARDVMSAATRLSLIGPLEAGRLVNSLSGFVETLVTAGDAGYPETSGRSSGGGGGGGGDEDGSEGGTDKPAWLLSEEWGGAGGVAGHVCQVDPIQDIVQGLHDRLYSRMFNS